jgi:hypothetical protein
MVFFLSPRTTGAKKLFAVAFSSFYTNFSSICGHIGEIEFRQTRNQTEGLLSQVEGG